MLWWIVAQVIMDLLAVAARPAPRRRRPPTPSADDIGELLARLTSIDPSLVRDSRRVSRSVVALAGLLEVELSRFRNVENRIDGAVGQLEATTGVGLDDGQLTRLARRLGVLNVRPALQRIERAHPDVSKEPDSDVLP